MPKCSRCPKERDRPGQRLCLTCHATNMRKWRKSHPMTAKQRRKDNARSYANVYLRRGKIERKACEICGEPAQMHHPDYSQPLKVRWYCRKHHLELHKRSKP